MKLWYAYIDKIGCKVIEGTDDIDSAYENAVKEFNCEISDIWAVSPNKQSLQMYKLIENEARMHPGDPR